MTSRIALPRLNPALSVIAGVMLAAYVALIVTTVVFAAIQTKLAQEVQVQRMEIGKLEGKYYLAIGKLDQTDPHSLGYVTPQHVQYVSAADLPNLTFAR
jgi:mannitol-specific phosphotransferase system IIBC component